MEPALTSDIYEMGSYTGYKIRLTFEDPPDVETSQYQPEVGSYRTLQ